jgi:hypothetical protein
VDCGGRFGAVTAAKPKKNLTQRRAVNAEKTKTEFNTESTEVEHREHREKENPA